MAMQNNSTQIRKRYKNKGFTLVELIVVIAVMAVVIGGLIVGIGSINRADAQKVSRYLNSELDSLRTSTLSVNADWKLKITTEDGKTVINTYKNNECVDTFRCGSRISLSYKDEAEAVEESITASGGEALASGRTLSIAYRKDNGRFKSISTSDTDTNSSSGDETGGNVTEYIKSSTATEKKSTYGIIYVKGRNKTYEVKLWYATGRVTVE